MQNDLTPRYLVILVILGWAIFSLWPTIEYQSLTDNEKEQLREEGKLDQLESNIIRQGLDLKGGMYIVLEADIPTLVKNLATNRNDTFEQVFNAASEKYKSNQNLEFFAIFRNEITTKGLKAVRYYHEYGSNLEDIILALEKETEDAINRVLEILQNRIDQFGVSEPTIQKQGDYRILVELAGIQDSDRARALLQSTALLEFFLVKNSAVTNEIVIQLDNILQKSVSDDEFAALNADTKEITTKEINEKRDDGVTTVDEIFGETESVQEDSLAQKQDILSESPLQSLIESIPGDMAVNARNMYALNKLLSKEEVQLKLKSSSGQFLFSNDSETIAGSGEYFRLYYIENKPELTGGVVEKAKANLGSLGGGNAGQPVVSLDMNSEGA